MSEKLPPGITVRFDDKGIHIVATSGNECFEMGRKYHYIPEARHTELMERAVGEARAEALTIRSEQIQLRAELTEMLEACKNIQGRDRLTEARISAEHLLHHIYCREHKARAARSTGAGKGSE